jgi:hypothetical protein
MSWASIVKKDVQSQDTDSENRAIASAGGQKSADMHTVAAAAVRRKKRKDWEKHYASRTSCYEAGGIRKENGLVAPNEF